MLPPLPHDRRITIVDHGEQIFIADLARNLAERGHEVTYVFCSGRTETRSQLEGLLSQSNVTIDDADVRYTPITKPLTLQLQVRLGLNLARKIRTGIVVGSQLPTITNWMLLTATRLRSNHYINWIQSFDINSRSLFGRHRVDSAHQVLCPSDELTKKVLRSGRQGPTTTLLNWAPIDLIPKQRRNNQWARKAGLDETRFWVTFSGPLEPQHPIGDISRMIKHLLHYHQFEFVFTGDGGGYEELAYDPALSLSPHVHFLGPRQIDTLPQLLGAANVLVVCLDPESNKYSTSNTALSYLCAGRPIIGLMDSRCITAKTILDAGAGRIVSTADSLIEAIIELAEDPEAAVLAGKRARAYAERSFEASTTTDRFIEATNLGPPQPSTPDA